VAIGSNALGGAVASQQVAADGSVTFPGLPVASYVVTLTGIAWNCALGGPPPGSVTVTFGGTASVALEVECVARGSAPDAEIAFIRDGQVHRVKADGSGLVQLTSSGSNSTPAWSPDGRRIAFARYEVDHSDIYVMLSDGRNVVRRTSAGSSWSPAWSPDGRKIAYSVTRNGQYWIDLMSADDDGSSTVGFLDDAASPSWSPDGGRIAFQNPRDGHLYVMNADLSGVTRLTNGGDWFGSPTWSPDGRRIAFDVYPDCTWDDPCDYYVGVMNADGSGRTRLLAGNQAIKESTWSPDGRALAVVSWGCSTTGCTPSIYRVEADGSGVTLIVANGHSPAWRR
jgi:Tol biopolymer transport system component